MPRMRLKAGAFRFGVGQSPGSMASSGGGMQHAGGHGAVGGGGGQVMGLAGQGQGVVPGRTTGGIGKRYGVSQKYVSPMGHLRGLGADEQATILTDNDPVRRYISGLELLFELPAADSHGKWNFALHQAMTKWVGRIEEPDDEKDMPSWGEAPAFTAKFAVDLVLLAMKSDVGVRICRVLLEAIGAPTTNSHDVLVFFKGVGNGSPTWIRSMRIFDAIERYIIGCEGGVVYGDPVVKYKGIGAAAADVVLPLLLVAVL